MERLEEIKERHKDYAENPHLYDWVAGKRYVEDVSYLLSLIDQYKKNEDKLIAWKTNYEKERQIRMETFKDKLDLINRGGWPVSSKANDILEKE